MGKANAYPFATSFDPKADGALAVVGGKVRQVAGPTTAAALVPSLPYGTRAYSASFLGVPDDAVLDPGTPVPGTDGYPALSNFLSTQGTAPKHLVIDRKTTVTQPLALPSNTYVRILPGCGIVNANGSSCPVFMNANPTAGTIVDENIWIDGGVINGHNDDPTMVHDQPSSAQKPWGWTVPLFFSGVRNLRITGLTIYRPRTFALWLMNWDTVLLSDITVDVVVKGGFNFDGLHINGPGNNLTGRNWRLTTYDDGFSISPDEPVGPNPVFPRTDVAWTYRGGDISDVDVSGVQFKASSFGGRLMCGKYRLDRCRVGHVRGVTDRQAVIIDNVSEQPTNQTGPGNVGSLMLDDWDVLLTAPGYKNCGAYISLKADSIRLKDWSRKHAPNTSPALPLVHTDLGADVGMLTIDGCDQFCNTNDTANLVLNDGRIGHLQLNELKAIRTPNQPTGADLIVNSVTGEIGSIRFNGFNVDGHSRLLNNSGLIGEVHLGGPGRHANAGGTPTLNTSVVVPRLYLSDAVHTRSLRSGTFTQVRTVADASDAATTLGTGLVARYPLSGSPWNDLSGNNRTLTAGGNGTIATPDGGPFGPIAFFDANQGQYLTRSGDAAFTGGSGALTIAGWLQLPLFTFPIGGPAQFPIVFARLAANGSDAEYVCMWDANLHRFQLNVYRAGAALQATITTGTDSAQQGQLRWFYLCYRYDGAQVKLNLNANATVTAAASLLNTNALPFQFGSDQLLTEKGHFRMAHWSVWSRALTDAEMYEYANGSLPPEF
jgi:hypothetical protein